MVEYWLRHCIYLNPDYDLVYAWALTTGLGMLESSVRPGVCLSPHYGPGYAWVLTTGMGMLEPSLRAWICLSPHYGPGYAWVLTTTLGMLECWVLNSRVFRCFELKQRIVTKRKVNYCKCFVLLERHFFFVFGFLLSVFVYNFCLRNGW